MQIKALLLGGVAGSLLTAATLGLLASLKINALVAEKIQLETRLDKLNWHQKNLKESKEALSDELQGLRQKQKQSYDQTVSALMQATAEAELAALYQLGSRALKAKDYAQAYFALSQVRAARPNFREIARIFASAEQGYRQDQQQAQKRQLAENYAKGLDAQLAQQFAQAQLYFQRVTAQNPSYRDSAARLRAINQQLNSLQKMREAEQKKQWLARTYQLGLAAQNQGQWEQAREAYLAIVKAAPRYKDTAQRLKKLPVTPVGHLAPVLNCYERGAAFGKCLKLGLSEADCNEVELASMLTQCKNNPDFQKGLKSISSQGNLSLLKGLPSLLGNL